MRSQRITLAVVAAFLLLGALPSWAKPPCNLITARDICRSSCSILGHGMCASYGLDFTGGCYIVYACEDGFSSREICSCGTGCFLAGTMITMADGTAKAIEQIAVGDLVLAYDEATGEMKPDRVAEVHDPVEWDFHLLVNGTMRLTPEHPVLSGGEWVKIGGLAVGDSLTRADGTALRIESIEVVHERATVYNFAVNPYESYVADGIIVHNKPPVPKDEPPTQGP